MARYIVSLRAQADLIEIARYTHKIWGEAQARRYLVILERAFVSIAAFPLLGRRADRVRPELRRREVWEHVVFYRQIEDGVRIVTVLHKTMVPSSVKFVQDE